MKNRWLSIPANFYFLLLLNSCLLFCSGCHLDDKIKTVAKPQAQVTNSKNSSPVPADAATILSRPEVPILCYHQLRDFRPSDSKTARDYIVPVVNFQEQIKLLADSGYHSILPDQLYDYLLYGKSLPSKPVIISFDDTRLDHYTVALAELNKYGFKGVFFIMTVSLNRPGYMTKEQVKQLADEGHVIGLHTWNHKNVKTFTEEDWAIQVQKPWGQLKAITGKPVDYFAYPFGLWNEQALEKIKQLGFKAAFQLSARRDESSPLFCIRRMIIPGEWNLPTMHQHLKNSF
jgi:peptidoglycan/xylan/chitin deacetylase (PgdA/CDA1 family)